MPRFGLVRTLLAVAFSCVVLTPIAKADGINLPRKWGIQGGIFLPSNDRVKDTLGDTWFRFGISPIDINVKKGWAFDPNIQIQYANRYDNRLLLIPATVGFSGQFKLKDSDIRPYVAARIGAAFTDYSIYNGLTTDKKSTIVPTSNVEAGLIFGDSFQLSLRYDWFGRTSDYYFDGLSIQAKFIILRF